MRKVAILSLLAVLAADSAAAAQRCADKPARSGRRSDCAPPARKLEPYDPDRQRAGSRPGFIDLGGGTEVRVGGRARYEYGYQR